MTHLFIKVNKLKGLLDRVSQNLDKIDTHNFDEVFPNSLDMMKKVMNLRAELISEFGVDNLISYESELFFRAKQIEDKFDNIVKIFLNEEKRLEKELVSTLQKKKLTVYQKV